MGLRENEKIEKKSNSRNVLYFVYLTIIICTRLRVVRSRPKSWAQNYTKKSEYANNWAKKVNFFVFFTILFLILYTKTIILY